MPDISSITLPSGSSYNLKDSWAREAIEAINNWEYIVSEDAATTPYGVTWDDGGTTITGTLVASDNTQYKIYLVPSDDADNNIYDEYITVKKKVKPVTDPVTYTYSWEPFGSTKLPDLTQYVKNKAGHSGGTAGDLAYKDSASGSFTPSGTVSQPSFTGSSTTSTGKFTPSGSVSLTNSNQTATVSKADSGEATYTPEGSVSTPTITVTPSTVTKYVAASADGGGSVTAGSAASCTMPTYTVANEVLTITGGSFTANTPTAVTLPSFAEQTIATGISSASSTQPSFTGTGARLVTENISIPSSASFTGTEDDVSVSGTPTGTVSQPSFTGTADTVTVS